MRVLVCFSLIFALSCAKPRHVVVTVDAALYEALAEVHSTEQMALCGAPSCANRVDMPIAGWSHGQSVAFNRGLLPLAESGRQLTIRLEKWQPGQPVPVEVVTLVNGLSQSLTAVLMTFPAGSTKEKLLVSIATIQQIVLSLLNQLLSR